MLYLECKHNPELVKGVDKILDDAFEGLFQKLWTKTLSNELDSRITSLMNDRFSYLGDLNFKIVTNMGIGGLLNYTPGNLWTLCFFNGYYFPPITFSKTDYEVTINKFHVFKMMRPHKIN